MEMNTLLLLQKMGQGQDAEKHCLLDLGVMFLGLFGGFFNSF